MSNRDALDAITAYQEAKKTEGIMRATPAPKTVDELAAEAVAALNELVDARVDAKFSAWESKLANKLRM